MSTKEELIEELVKANGDRAWSADMADRIERGELELPRIHSDEAHALAKKLRAEAVSS